MAKLDETLSKSQRKREAHAMQALGQRLIDLKAQQLATIPLPEELREAIEGAKRITQRIARKREMQYVGKLLREIDPAPVEAALERLDATGIQERLRQHRLERWRDALVEGGDAVIQKLVESAPAADRSQLRQLVRKARQEAASERPPVAARQLFRQLRELDLVDELPEDPLSG